MADWGNGRYELTADTLWPASERVVSLARVAPGERVLDLACGTGNAALLAARAGALVTGLDPAARLLDVARGRLAAEQLPATFVPGEAGALPFADHSFDVAFSIFGVIFAPDARAAAAELARVVRPGGRVLLTSWVATGAIASAGRLVREAMLAAMPVGAPSPPPPAPWGDVNFLRELFAVHRAAVEVTESTLAFAADSPAAWFAEQEVNHPIWRLAHELLAPHPGAWEALRSRSVAVLTELNEEPAHFRTTSRYLIAEAVLHS